MRITWLISSPVSTVAGQWHSPLASLRYRVLAPARYLEREGHQNQFVRIDQTRAGEQAAIALCADVVVVSKVLAEGSLELAMQAKALGSRVVVDLCDDHFDTPALGATYHALCRMADRVVASTRAMADAIQNRTGQPATVVDDPYEGPGGLPRFAPSNTATKLLWFGHPVNFDTVADMMPKLGKLAQNSPLSLHVVSDPTNNGIRAFLAQTDRQFGPGLSTHFTVWSPEATWQAIEECDLVVVPSLASVKKLVKSPNRVVEPLHAGRFVVAYPLPSYTELADFLWLGDNVADGVAWALANSGEVQRRIAAGQAYVHRRFDPFVIGRAWETLLLQTAESERRAA